MVEMLYLNTMPVRDEVQIVGDLSAYPDSSMLVVVLPSTPTRDRLDISKSGDIFETVCNGCGETCHDCRFDGQQAAPICISLEEAEVEHGTSHGGFTTVEELFIEPGYWRATNLSTNILECYNSVACPGGITSGSCEPGYEGPCESLRRFIFAGWCWELNHQVRTS